MKKKLLVHLQHDKDFQPYLSILEEVVKNIDLEDYFLEEYEYALNEVHEGKVEELVFVETDFGIRVCEC